MPHCAFTDPGTLASCLADDVSTAVEQQLRKQPSATIVVPGGRTPVPFLRALAGRPLPWARVRVMLADDRCVPLDDPASNARMVREAFADSPALDSVVVVDPSLPDALERWEAALADAPAPFAAVVVGMGADGHFASLFPGMPGIALALDPDGRRGVVRGAAPVEPRNRLSLTLAALLDTPVLALHLNGADKLATLRRASSPGSVIEMPVRALLQQRRVPLRVYHAP
jgi:6-phosphogluconolactonase